MHVRSSGRRRLARSAQLSQRRKRDPVEGVEVVAHVLERLWRGGDSADDQRQRGHEVDEPREERTALKEVVMAFDEGRLRLVPPKRLNLPLSFCAEPAPQGGSYREAVGSVGLEDEERVGHRTRSYLAEFLSRGFGL